jgi:hypothetical protein
MRKRSFFVTGHAAWRRTCLMWRNWTESCCDEVKFYLTKRTLLFASTMFNGRCILTPYIPHKAHTDAVHVNTTTLVTLSLFRISHFNGGIRKKLRLIGKEWSRQRQSTNYFPLKSQYATLTVWYWPVSLKTGCGTNPKSNLPSWVATYHVPFPRRSSPVHFFDV